MAMEYEDPIVSDVISSNDLMLNVSSRRSLPGEMLLFDDGEGDGLRDGEGDGPPGFDDDDPVIGGGSSNGEDS